MRRIKPKADDLKNYRSEGAVIRDIMHNINNIEETEENINITEEEIKISPKLMTLLRMGLVDKSELETMKRALKAGEDSLKQPVLRKQIFELFNKLVEAVTDDQQIWVRMRKRLQTDTKGEEE